MENLLYVGDLWYGSTALHRLHAIEALDFNVVKIDSTLPKLNLIYKIFYKIFYKLKRPPDLGQVNKRILKAFKHSNFNYIWIDKGLLIYPNTFRNIKLNFPNCKVIFYSPDDMLNSNNQNNNFLRSIPLYDVMVTTKSYNLTELHELGAKNVIFIGNAYDPSIHFPMDLPLENRNTLYSPVGFIGGFEEDRFQNIIFLCENGISVGVYGASWKKYIDYHALLKVYPQNYWGLEYTRVINSIDINLCFLRKVNRDLQTTRSIEIPACGAFMLAERTSEHTLLFEEGKEADFFSDKDELLQKVKYYLISPDKRMQIARAGRQRCLSSKYSNSERLQQVFQTVSNGRI